MQKLFNAFAGFILQHRIPTVSLYLRNSNEHWHTTIPVSKYSVYVKVKEEESIS
jgi:hypothetical protein